ncbi:WD repeat-containing protein 43 [Chironomus tepperi]|uniref:WD repeat-containing protein 43 n=1 Tax=Chironomus tepperi TaxID=113505 RepID=UPI00391EEE90
MENLHLKEFSPDQKLFAVIQSDGVLKIYDTETSILKQEYIPNLHLSTPCTALKWIKMELKKKKKSELSNGTLYILLGTNKGDLCLYSYATAKIEATFKGEGHSKSITSIDHNGTDTIYTTGLDSQVIKWNIAKCRQESSFEVGPDKPSAICLLENGQQVATASKTIKIWDLETNQLVKSFTGHSSDVIILKSFTHDDTSYILSASKNDRNLSLWNVDDSKSAVFGTFTLLNNSPNFIDCKMFNDQLRVACICRNESLSYFDVPLKSIKSKKPVKVKFTVEIASDNDKNVTHIPIICASILSFDLMIGYGDMIMKFETITNSQETTNTVLVRKDPTKLDVSKAQKKDAALNEALNIVTPITDGNAEVLNIISAKKKSQKPTEIPLGVRFDNLTVGTSKKPNAKKLTHQLVQGLHGHDAVILRNVLRQTDEETVRLTVKYLEPKYVMPFVNELSLLMSKKTAGSEMALIWLRHLIQTHSSSLMSYGHINLMNTFGTTLGIIDHRTQNLSGLMRLRGRLDLLVGQLKQTSDFDDEVHNENVLVYEDSDDESNKMDAKSVSSNEDIYDGFEDDDDEDDEGIREIIRNGKHSISLNDSEGLTNDEDYEQMDTS